MMWGANAFGADDKALIAQAREEAGRGKFQIMVSSPKAESGQRMIMDAFQKRFDIKVDWEWMPLTAPVSAPRIAQQVTSGIKPPSAIGGYPYQTFDAWIAKNGLDMTVDWLGQFGAMFPAIRSAAVDTVLPPYHGRMLRQWDAKYVMVYNTNLVKRADVPTTFDELTSAKWRGRFAMSSNTAVPLDLLALELGPDQTLELTKKLLANRPRFKPGPPAVVGAIATGEVVVGISGYTALAEAQREKGAPIAWVPMKSLYVGPLFVFMLKDAPQPTLGKLFLAWLVTEGRQVQEAAEYLSSYADKESSTTKAIATASPNIDVVEVRNEKEYEMVDHIRREIMKIVAGASGISTK
jgi:iron(III) transport system substrate-binding protein